MNSPRILLLCSSRLALPAMQQLAYMNVLAAVVVPQHTDEWKENVQFVLQQSGIPVLVVSKETYVQDITGAIEKYGVTMGLMVTFSFRIPAVVYRLPVQGFFNVHPGPLPQYRGVDPIFQQIKRGEKQAGVAIHYVEDSFDTGPIVMQEMIRLHPTDTYGILTTQLGQLAARLALLLLKLIEMDVAIPTKQQDEIRACYYGRHGAKDVMIDWQQMNAPTIVALINACNPWNKGATTQLNGRIVRLLEAAVLPQQALPDGIAPGTILQYEQEKMLVAATDKSILAVSLLYADEGFLSAARLHQLGFIPGHQFGDIT